MKYAVAAAILAAVVKAQTIDDVPSCAVPCLDEAIASETDCDTTDYACVCENFEAVQGVATACVIEECGATVALNEVLPAVEALCAAQGGDDSEDGDSEETTSAEEPPMETTTVVEPTVVEPTMEPTMEPSETVIETTIQTTFTSTVCEYNCGEATPTPMPTPSGSVPEEPETPEQPPNAAGALAPIGGLVLAVAAFAL
ncbi:hemoglobin and hemoglobin-haptoglobin-binding protein-like protein [Emericellopsis cladophorae]|uniref:Hemoglobin and hemoglobin-haptoglobin-binding protein-like protein n=1 Tax=Emericellopsis cladophorae TaxID=2686198 RepID=A0A9P9Y0M7_9HYPO|nr:hemoglobin and hemoglobin-haptoglobin-binding protein-like protein [Emericellopsis cladophorae]KAI6781180.1 hemoglobin and hemoglobin-haptoglobin-binding protein-like protein [Emericellopsis cladophorae]